MIRTYSLCQNHDTWRHGPTIAAKARLHYAVCVKMQFGAQFVGKSSAANRGQET